MRRERRLRHQLLCSRSLINGGSNDAIHNTAAFAGDVTIEGFTLRTNDDSNDDGLDLSNISGTWHIRNNLIGPVDDGITIVNTNTNLTAFITGNQITGSGSAGGYNTTDQGIFVRAQGTSVVDVTVLENEFSGLDHDFTDFEATNSAQISAMVVENTFQDGDTGAQWVDVDVFNNARVSITMVDNDVSDLASSAATTLVLSRQGTTHAWTS